MMTFIVNGKSHQIPTDVNDAITVIMRENEQLRAERNRSGVELRNAVAQAVLAEREACAQVCDEWQERFLGRMVMGAPHLCAKQIRSRSDK